MKKLCFYFLIGILITCLSVPAFALPQQPAELDTLNRTQVLFQWNGIHSADGYRLQIALNEEYDPFEVALIHDIESETNAQIVNDGLDWGVSYLWRYAAMDAEDNQGEWSFIHRFSIMAFPDSLANLAFTVYDADQMQPGLTLFGWDGGYVAASDIEGNIKFINTGANDIELLPSGDFLSIEKFPGGNITTERTIDGDVLFASVPGLAHHEVDKLPNGNYLTISKEKRWVMNPNGDGDSLLWKADLILETNSAGDTLFRWSEFDHFSLEDFEQSEIDRVPEGGEMDWTHSNSCHFDPENSSIVVSVRHLSRVTLFDYPTGDVIWNMGKEMPSGEVNFGHDLNFSYEHDAEWLPNGNLLMFDNHNLGPEDSSRALEISIDLDREVVAQNVWECWISPKSLSQGDADRLENGNTLIASGRTGMIYEVNSECERLWEVAKTNFETGRAAKFYRAERVSDIYPQVFTVKGPNNDDHVPDGESYFQFAINNVGHCQQTYRYQVTDTEGWFDVERWMATIAAGETDIRTIYGNTPDGIAIDTVTVTVYPVGKPNKADVWTAILTSDPDMSADKPEINIPNDLNLVGAWPNPFNSTTTIGFSLPHQGDVNLSICDCNGRAIETLISGNLSAGDHTVAWDGTNAQGLEVSAGMYYYILKFDGRKAVGRMSYIK